MSDKLIRIERIRYEEKKIYLSDLIKDLEDAQLIAIGDYKPESCSNDTVQYLWDIYECNCQVDEINDFSWIEDEYNLDIE